MNDEEKYDCETCCYRIYDEPFCGCCMQRVMTEFAALKAEKKKQTERNPTCS